MPAIAQRTEPRTKPAKITRQKREFCASAIPFTLRVPRILIRRSAPSSLGGSAWRLLTFRDATFVQRRFLSCEPMLGPLHELNLEGIGWVIAGGESGPNCRPMHLDWACSLRDMCKDAEVPFFFKQWGGRTPKAAGRELDGVVWNEMPPSASVAD